MFEEREYQVDAENQIRSGIARHKRLICCLPTGSGKTVIFSRITKKALDKGSRVLILVHRKELIRQTFKTLNAMGIWDVNLIVSGSKKKIEQCNIAMVETFHRRYKGNLSGLGLDLVIVDEIHIGNFRKIVEGLHCHVLGVSATPVASGPTALNTFFDNIVCPVDIQHLIENQYLARAKTFSVEHDFSGLKKAGGEFTERSLFMEFTNPKLYAGTLENYERYAKGRKAMCFGVNVKHSMMRTETFIKHGFSAKHVNGKTPHGERDEIINGFLNGGFKVLNNVGITTTGFDDPRTTCIIQDHATASLTKHLQTLGRGSRVYDLDNVFFPGKREFIIIDQGKNYLRHGLYGDRIDWNSIFHNPKLATNTIEDKKLFECPSCGAIIKLARPKCAYCGNERSVKEVEDGLQERIVDVRTAKEIRDYKIQNLPPHLRTKKYHEMSRHELFDYASIMGYSKKWAFVQMNLRKRYGKR